MTCVNLIRSWTTAILLSFSNKTDLLVKVIMKCVNIKLWDILGCFHYILNAPRIYAYCRYFIDRKWSILVLYYTEKHAICLKDYIIRSFLSIQYVHGDLCKHFGIDSSTDHPYRYSNLFLNAYINRHVHAKYIK